MPDPRALLDAARTLATAALVVVVAAGVLPGPASAGDRAGAGVPAGREATARPNAAAVAVPATASLEPAPQSEDAAEAEASDIEAPELRPSIAYEDAMAHEADDIEFEPGARVTVGYTPRAGDRWPVGGEAPTRLPAGRASGRQMAASQQGSRWAKVPGRTAPTGGDDDEAPPATPDDAPIDRPVSDAHGAAYLEPAADDGVDLAASAGLRRQVFGFLPYWELPGASSKLNYGLLSTIAYFSVGADRTGALRKRDKDGRSTTGWGGWTSSNMTSVIRNAHQHGTRVVLTVSVFAWTTAQANTQRALLGSAAARRNLARQVAAAVRDRGADGVNLDFEPLAGGYSDEFVALLRTMRSELNRVRKGYQLTYDTTGYIGNYPLEASVGSKAADAIFVMGYDYRTSGSRVAGSIDPLSGPGYDLADTIRAYTRRVSPSRIILGLPWYGRAWSTEGPGARSRTLSGARYGYSAAVNYENVASLVAKHGRRWDALEKTPFIAYRRQNCTSAHGCVTSWRQVYFDDAASLRQRYALVNDYGLRGAGMWALGYDGGRSELYRALSESFRVDKSAPQAGIRLLATSQVDEGFTVAWSARDRSSVASYDVQVSVDGGPWATWLSRTRATSNVWLGAHGHGYAFRVRATDSKGHVGAWNVGARWDATPSLAVGGFGRVAHDGLPYRSGPDTAAVRLGTLKAGTIVAITRGPVRSDGYAWYEVTEPIREWSPVSFVERGVWIAARSSDRTNVTPFRAPNTTRVDAGIRDLDFGAGPGSALGAGTSARAVRTFSPNGDGLEDRLRLRWRNARALDSLTLRVFRSDGRLLGSRPIPEKGAGAHAWDWNGVINGARLRNGNYVLQLVGVAHGTTYAAPSRRPTLPAQVSAFGVTVDTVAPRVTSSSATSGLISPNGDGVRESARLGLASTGATRWAVQIASSAGLVRTASGTGGRIAFTWRGERNGGGRVPDGRYTATLLAIDAAGNRARRSYTITVDTTGPVIRPAASPKSFSPNGDGAAEVAQLSWAANERGTGRVRILRGSKVVRSWPVRGATSWSVPWNGRNAAGRPMPDGRYTVRVELADVAGNRRSSSASVVLDRTAGTLRWAGSFFPQDADALAASSTLSWRLTRDAKTTLRLYTASGALVRTVWAGKAQHAGVRRWTWDGRRADGSWAVQGRYEARLTVASRLGTTTLTRPVWASAFAATPSATRVRAGQTLRVTFATIEPLGSAPAVTFRQPGRGPVTVTATRRGDGTYAAAFTVRRGKRGAASLQISAKDRGDHVNRTTLAIRVMA
jgi:spore germination protein YaaH/flagellar hook assembly protein FlgD